MQQRGRRPDSPLARAAAHLEAADQSPEFAQRDMR
jgi:hypothetical protein